MEKSNLGKVLKPIIVEYDGKKYLFESVAQISELFKYSKTAIYNYIKIPENAPQGFRFYYAPKEPLELRFVRNFKEKKENKELDKFIINQ